MDDVFNRVAEAERELQAGVDGLLRRVRQIHRDRRGGGREVESVVSPSGFVNRVFAERKVGVEGVGVVSCSTCHHVVAAATDEKVVALSSSE